MMQGDSYGISIEILKSDGAAVAPADVLDVEITIGLLQKTFSYGEVRYDDASGAWIFPVTQEETFKLPSVRAKAQVRVLWKSGDVEGVALDSIDVRESISKEVL